MRDDTTRVPDNSGRANHRSRRIRLLAGLAAIAVALTTVGGAAATLWPAGDNNSDECAAPTVEELRTLASTSDRVIVGDVTGEVTLQDGITKAVAWEMNVVQALVGAEKLGKIVVWPSLEIAETPAGRLLVFLVAHPQTQMDGETVDGYDVAGSSGVLLAEGESWRRVCRFDLSPPVDFSTPGSA